MVTFLKIVRNWKIIAAIAFTIAMWVTIVKLRSAYRAEEQKVSDLRQKASTDSVTIMNLERDIDYFKEDTAQLRQSLRLLDDKRQKAQQKDRDENKGLSSKLPSKDQVKNKKQPTQ